LPRSKPERAAETATPARRDVEDGLAYELWLPASEPPWPAVLILHGAGSRKENHADFARLASVSGFAALAFDQRGHGESAGAMGPGAIQDVIRMARLLASEDRVSAKRIGVRGSSMGGFLAIHAAAVAPEIHAAVAICPAGEDHLRRGLRREDLDMKVDREAMDAWLGEHDLRQAVALMGPKPLLLIHARGDESIPWTWSHELHEAATEPRKLVVLAGGDHRSAQHDAEIQGMSLRWLERSLA
jgi:fermentation-respiration switch protein FrsA (DUF1100 family)